MQNKSVDDLIFDSINYEEFYGVLQLHGVPGLDDLTPKVFRTFRASEILYKGFIEAKNELKKNQTNQALEYLKMKIFDVAKFCNHVRNGKKKNVKEMKEKIQK